MKGKSVDFKCFLKTLLIFSHRNLNIPEMPNSFSFVLELVFLGKFYSFWADIFLSLDKGIERHWKYFRWRLTKCPNPTIYFTLHVCSILVTDQHNTYLCPMIHLRKVTDLMEKTKNTKNVLDTRQDCYIMIRTRLSLFQIGMICQSSSVYLTVFISLERFIAVCTPLQAKHLCTQFRWIFRK